MPVSDVDKMVGHVLRMIRREESSMLTVWNISRLSLRKQVLVVQMAYRMLAPHEWGLFRERVLPLLHPGVALRRLVLKIPFGNFKSVQKGACVATRNAS